MARVKFPPIGSVVEVRWMDAWIDYGESQPALWDDECIVVTYGILMRVGSVITIASEKMPNGDLRSASHIPRGMVVRVRRLT